MPISGMTLNFFEEFHRHIIWSLAAAKPWGAIVCISAKPAVAMCTGLSQWGCNKSGMPFLPAPT
jgi:hypothetical protein